MRGFHELRIQSGSGSAIVTRVVAGAAIAVEGFGVATRTSALLGPVSGGYRGTGKAGKEQLLEPDRPA
jgi:hypothetical protein